MRNATDLVALVAGTGVMVHETKTDAIAVEHVPTRQSCRPHLLVLRERSFRLVMLEINV
jgi:hypothetical protein